MTDCFARLNEARRPWLEPEALRQKFLALSSQAHPDRVHNAGDAAKSAAQENYAELNVAYNRLREPKERLQHLLELETGAKPSQVQRIPDDLMDLSLGVAVICREADVLIAEKNRTTSPMLQVQFFERGEESAEKLRGLQRQLNAKLEFLTSELKRVDAEWEGSENRIDAGRHSLLPRLEELWRLFSYFTRWSAQVQERLVQLSL